MVQIDLFNDSTRPQKNPKKIWTQNESNTGKKSDCNIKNRTAQRGTQKMTADLTDRKRTNKQTFFLFGESVYALALYYFARIQR